MSKCNKIKNPCRICLGPVTNRNGLQCQGICQNWVHFGCLNYTPGRIKDIKAGIIKVTCPCPDCKTMGPKEYRTDEPYSCDNSRCPANRPPKCQNDCCPTNLRNPPDNSNKVCPPCPLSQCGKECKKHSAPVTQGSSVPNFLPPCAPMPPPPMPKCPVCPSPTYSPQSPQSGLHSSCLPSVTTCPQPCHRHTIYQQMGVASSISDNVLDMHTYPSGYSNTSSERPCDIGVAYASIHDNHNLTSVSVFEHMCNAVGQLTRQINDVMGKMKQAINEKHGEGCVPNAPQTSCSHKGPRSSCPKPCFCPGNPAKKELKSLEKNAVPIHKNE